MRGQSGCMSPLGARRGSAFVQLRLAGRPYLRIAPPGSRPGCHARRTRPLIASPPNALSTPLFATDPWLILAALSTCGAAAQVLERRTRVGRLLSSPMMALTLGMAATASGLLPPACAVYDGVWTFIMPLAAGLFMLQHDVSRLRDSGGPLLASFLLGAMGMLAGALLAWQLLGRWMGDQGAQLAACLCASYIGGFINFAAVAQAVSLSPALIPPAMAADNIAMAGLLALLLSCPLHLLATRGTTPSPAAAAAAGSTGGEGEVQGQQEETGLAAAGGSGGIGTIAPAGHTSTLALDGQPLLTEQPSADQVNACMAAARVGRKQSELQALRPPEDGSITSSSSSSRAGGGALDLSGQPLMTQVPEAAEVFAAMQAARRGEASPGNSSCSSWDGSGEDEGPLPAAWGSLWDVAEPGGQLSGLGLPAPASNSSSSGSSGVAGGGGWQQPSTLAGAATSSRRWDRSGAVALDGQPLLTEDPSASAVATAIERARSGGSWGGSISDDEGGDASGGGLWCPPPHHQPQHKQPPASAPLAPRGRKGMTARLPGAAAGGVGGGEGTGLKRAADAQPSSSSSSNSRGLSTESPSVLSNPPAGPRPAAGAAAAAAAAATAAPAPTVESLAASVAAAAVAVAVGKQISSAFNAPALQLMTLAVAAIGISAVAAFFQHQEQQLGKNSSSSSGTSGSGSGSVVIFSGASQLGGALMLLFFATIGASSGSVAGLSSTGPLIAFITVMTGVHWLLLGLMGRALGLSPQVLLLGSNANIGGPATAAGLASSRGWGDLVQPSMLCGSLGYALGTGAGLLVAKLAAGA